MFSCYWVIWRLNSNTILYSFLSISLYSLHFLLLFFALLCRHLIVCRICACLFLFLLPVFWGLYKKVMTQNKCYGVFSTFSSNNFIVLGLWNIHKYIQLRRWKICTLKTIRIWLKILNQTQKIKRNSMLKIWKNLHFQNAHTTQSYLQVQYDCYQNFSVLCAEIDNSFKIYMEPQTFPFSQDNLK